MTISKIYKMKINRNEENYKIINIIKLNNLTFLKIQKIINLYLISNNFFGNFVKIKKCIYRKVLMQLMTTKNF